MKPRKPWIAGLLSLLLPGLGQVYDGAPARGALLFASQSALSLAGLAILVALPLAPANALLCLLLLVGPYVAIVVDAVLLARRRQDFSPRPYNRWFVYAGLMLLSAFVIQPAAQAALHRELESYRIPGTSMEPTILAGDYLTATSVAASERSTIKRGELAIFMLPDTFHVGPAVKRVVGIGGDTLAMRRKVLFLDGRPQHEPYVEYTDRENDLYVPSMMWQKKATVQGLNTTAYRPTRDNWGPVVVPRGEYFVLGDNRDDSEDSRYYGTLPVRQFIGRPRTIYFSRNPNGVIRWDRIGQPIR